MRFNILIFSKDRAMQLELLLRSMFEKLDMDSDDEVFILYKASNDSFKDGYDKTKHKYRNKMVYFIKEDNFMEDTREIVKDGFYLDYSLILVDDCVFINIPDGLNDMMEDYKHDNFVCSASLRLNENIDYCQPANLKIDIPMFIKKDSYLKWDWRQVDPRGCWGYPHPTDSTLYRNEYLKNYINTLNFNNSGTFESAFNNSRRNDLPYMLSLKKSIVISIPNNSTQQGWANVNGGNDEYSIDNLNKKYLEGYIISTENLYGMDNKACHVIVPYIFKKE